MTIIIRDLPKDEDLDRKAMSSVHGGFMKNNMSGSDSQSQVQPGPPFENPSAFGPGPGTIEVNNSPDQSFWSFTRSPTELAKKHTF